MAAIRRDCTATFVANQVQQKPERELRKVRMESVRQLGNGVIHCLERQNSPETGPQCLSVPLCRRINFCDV